MLYIVDMSIGQQKSFAYLVIRNSFKTPWSHDGDVVTTFWQCLPSSFVAVYNGLSLK